MTLHVEADIDLGDGGGTITGTVTRDGTVFDLAATLTPRQLWPFDDDTDVVLTEATVLDVDATVNSLDQNGHELTIRPGVTLRSRGNIVNDAPLRIDGSDPDLVTVIEFIDVDESAMLGSTAGHSGPIPQDVGLWTVEHGELDVHGAPKLAWCRSASAITAGQSEFVADATLEGWRVGDEVVITPTGTNEYDAHRSTISAVDGTAFTIAAPTPKAHPTVDVWGCSYTAEFLNLTRNVKIQGTPAGRAHTVFLHCHHPQHISHIEYSHMGPMGPLASQGDPHPSLPLGRWAVHFHHGGDDLAGSTVEGVVCHDIGTYAFVPHKANGITFTDCIAHEVGIGAYWWDDHQAVARQLGQAPTASTKGDITNGAVFDRCVASQLRSTKDWNGNPVNQHVRLGWSMGNGINNATIDCVAVGVRTDWRFEGGGYSWRSTHSGTWATDGSVAHNSIKGIDLWNNNDTVATIHAGMVQYRCERAVRDGAYRTVFAWHDLDLVGQFSSVAGKRTTAHQQFVIAPNPDILRLRVDADGRWLYPFLGADHHRNFITDALVVRVADSHFKGGTKACVGFNNGDGLPHIYEFHNPTFVGNEWWFEPACPALSVVKWFRDGQPTVTLRPASYTGSTAGMVWHPEWNAWAA